jgi:hypothetical protein
MTFYMGGCLAGHGDDEYTHATSEWIKEFEENGGKSFDSGEKCGTFEVGKSGEVLNMTFNEPMQFNEGDIIRLNYVYEADASVTLSIEIERA